MRLLVEASVICGHFVMEGLSTSTLDLLEPSGYKSYVAWILLMMLCSRKRAGYLHG